MSVGDNLRRERVGPRSSILDLLERENGDAGQANGASVADAQDTQARGDFDRLPKAGDDYRAHARPGNQVETTLHVMSKDAFYLGFSWGGYDGVDFVPPEKAGGGPVLVLRFDGLQPSEIRIEGRNLSVLHAYLGQGRIGWIRELPAGVDIAGDRETVISRITVRQIKS